MSFGRLSFTERRRRRLAKKVDRLDRLETRNNDHRADQRDGACHQRDAGSRSAWVHSAQTRRAMCQRTEAARRCREAGRTPGDRSRSYSAAIC